MRLGDAHRFFIDPTQLLADIKADEKKNEKEAKV